MFEIKTLNKISPFGLEVFDSNYKCADDFENPDAVIVRSASMHELELPSNLKAIARAGAGVNNIPIDRCSEQGVVVFNTPGANANAVKELVIAGLLLASRKVVPAIEWSRTLKGEGDQVGKLVEKGKSSFAGPEIMGKTLGVIGLGAIGILVANAAKALGMNVYGYDPFLSVDAAWKLSSSTKHAASLKEIYENCDYITVHVPLNSETKHMINSESIKLMKNGVRILNFSRGELVCEEDIIEAVSSGKVACYVTDFPSDAVIGIDNIITIPHLGASTPESEDNCAKMAAQELVDFLENGNIKNSVNLPNAEMAREGDVRITVIHKNVPNMLSQISAVVSQSGANIENMLNRSKKDMAYTILDVAGKLDASVADSIKAIDGVIRVNVL